MLRPTDLDLKKKKVKNRGANPVPKQTDEASRPSKTHENLAFEYYPVHAESGYCVDADDEPDADNSTCKWHFPREIEDPLIVMGFKLYSKDLARMQETSYRREGSIVTAHTSTHKQHTQGRRHKGLPQLIQIVAAQVSLVELWGIGLLNLLTKVVVELLDEEEAAEEDRSNNGTLQTCKVDPTSYSLLP